MREDMYKVIVERPRRGKGPRQRVQWLRTDDDAPARLGMRAGYGYLGLNENLSPLRRYLHAQVGRPWNKVYAEICAQIDRRNTVQQHIHQHIRQFIAIDVELRDGVLVDRRVAWRPLGPDGGIAQALYVDPRTGLIRRNLRHRSWKQRAADDRRREADARVARLRVLEDRKLLLMRLDGVWYRVEVAELPPSRCVDDSASGWRNRRCVHDSRYDVVLKRPISRASAAELRDLYGADDLHAVSKRQLSTREIRAHDLG